MEGFLVSLLLDTHALVWARQDPAKLGAAALEAIRGASADELAISDISLLETALLLKKERIRTAVGHEEFLRLLAAGLTVLPVSPAIAARAMEMTLPHGDPFDRTILATAAVYGLNLVSRDRTLAESRLVPVLW